MHAERLVSPQSFKGNCFFNSKGQANALLIDAEPKVIDRIIKVGKEAKIHLQQPVHFHRKQQ